MALNISSLTSSIKKEIIAENNKIINIDDPLKDGNSQSEAEAAGDKYLDAMAKAIATAVVNEIKASLIIVKSIGQGNQGAPVSSESTKKSGIEVG